MTEIKLSNKNALNEAIEARCNMETPKAEVETTGVVPVVYATAINDHDARNDKLEDDFKEAEKTLEDFVEENQEQEKKIETTPAMKKLKLSEELFREEMNEANPYYGWSTKAKSIADDISEFLSQTYKFGDKLNDYLDEYDLEHIGKAMDALYDFAESLSLEEGRKATKPDAKPGDIVYKQNRDPVADIIQDELTVGEVAYKVRDDGRKSPTRLPSLNLSNDEVGISDDSKGYYIKVNAKDEETIEKVKEIAKKYNKETEVVEQKNSIDNKYPLIVKIRVTIDDFDEPYRG